MRVLQLLLLLGVVGILASTLVWSEHYLWLSFGIVILAIIIFLLHFERRKIVAREIVLLAVMAAIASVSRIPFAAIPSVQPTTFVIMMAGFVFGKESGFIIGVVSALASNMILGQGPWTPWQMIAWGLVGFSAGLLRNWSVMKGTIGKVGFAIIWGFLFGWIMNIWGLLALTGGGTGEGGLLDPQVLIPYFISSALFDSMHAVSNVVFLLLFGGVWVKLLERFKMKYGLLEYK
ncbi:ECF transporter S component [Bacillus alkalicola]|uniref:ECF transporter S component n=2 Tax=Bacillales TaxID=1385 RepID=A0ABS6K1V0_9BACI|nr:MULTISPECIES: ECF transporter S component [Bacillaceae]MBU9723375.1 ECF transporter S component [Bacillus alkalicola]